MPANILPSKILPVRIKKVSFGERYNRANNVTIFASPNLIPGIGSNIGSCASIVNIVKAIAHKIAENAILFVFDVDLSFLVSILLNLLIGFMRDVEDAVPYNVVRCTT